jgi:hypothetical protein
MRICNLICTRRQCNCRRQQSDCRRNMSARNVRAAIPQDFSHALPSTTCNLNVHSGRRTCDIEHSLLPFDSNWSSGTLLLYAMADGLIAAHSRTGAARFHV